MQKKDKFHVAISFRGGPSQKVVGVWWAKIALIAGALKTEQYKRSDIDSREIRNRFHPIGTAWLPLEFSLCVARELNGFTERKPSSRWRVKFTLFFEWNRSLFFIDNNSTGCDNLQWLRMWYRKSGSLNNTVRYTRMQKFNLIGQTRMWRTRRKWMVVIGLLLFAVDYACAQGELPLSRACPAFIQRYTSWNSYPCFFFHNGTNRFFSLS